MLEIWYSKFQLLPPCTPVLPLAQRQNPYLGNITSFTVGGHKYCDQDIMYKHARGAGHELWYHAFIYIYIHIQPCGRLSVYVWYYIDVYYMTRYICPSHDIPPFEITFSTSIFILFGSFSFLVRYSIQRFQYSVRTGVYLMDLDQRCFGTQLFQKHYLPRGFLVPSYFCFYHNCFGKIGYQKPQVKVH